MNVLVPVKADRSVNIERSSALIASTCGNARVGGDSANTKGVRA